MAASIAEDAARLMLKIVVEDLGLRPDSVVSASSFTLAFSRLPWRSSDYDLGRRFAQEMGWFETAGSMLRLTGLGYEVAGGKS